MGRCMCGAWHGAWVVVGLVMWLMCRGWDNCMCILPGLVMLDLGVWSGLVGGGGEEVVGVVLLQLD